MISIAPSVMFLILAIIGFVVSLTVVPKELKKYLWIGQAVAVGLAIFLFVLSMIVTVPPGHTGVAVLFGEVKSEARSPGMHFENPLYDWKYYDCRQKTHKETMKVPSQDQLLTKMDVSVQYKIESEQTPNILSDTGSVHDVINVHMIPTLRSVLREQGKTVKRSEDFFLDATQAMIQEALFTKLTEKLNPKGMLVQEILLRDIVLPDTIRIGVEEKKKREQEAEKQKAELRRFETEQQQKVASAEAELGAAQKQAEQKRVLADAQAYEIMKINEAIAKNPAYIQLQALKTLESISKDKAAKIYFLNGDSPTPLPLMHIDENK